jgi:hypothetical protein
MVLGHGDAVDAVVGGHDQPRAALDDQLLERRQIQLVKGAFIDSDIDREPVGLGVLGDMVLCGGGDPVGLQPAHVCRPPSGVRYRLTVGVSRMSTPCGAPRAASSPPSRSTRGSSQIAASAVGEGGATEGSRSSQR